MVNVIIAELLRCGFTVGFSGNTSTVTDGVKMSVYPPEQSYEDQDLDAVALRTIRQIRKAEVASGKMDPLTVVRDRSDMPTCCVCCRIADDIPGLVDEANAEETPVFDYAMEDGTYNRDTNRFCCTVCYVHIGAPSAPGRGWKAW